MNYQQLINKIIKEGKIINSRGINTLELINITLEVNSLQCLFYSSNCRSLSQVRNYLIGEICWYLSGNQKVDFIVNYSKFWNKLKNDSNKVNSNYGYLVFYKKNKDNISQYEWCKQSLLNDIQSRQAIILYNNQDYYYKGNKDFICTQNQHFLIRDNKLTSTIYIRSSDAILGLTYDIPWYSIVQQSLLIELSKKHKEITNGNITIFIGSSHIYEDKIELAIKMIDEGIQSESVKIKEIFPLYQSDLWYKQNISKYLTI